VTPLGWLRRVRIQALLARQLENWREVWVAYQQSAAVPVLKFRDGRVLHHGADDAPVFLFLEVFANGCYRKMMPAAVHGPIVDIGANIGAFTIDCATHYPEATIHAYEPHPESREMLRRNVVANGFDGRVTIWPEAVAGVDGEVAFYGGGASLEAGVFATGGDSVLVPSVSLETVLARAGGQVGLLKVDAEGAEFDIFEGARGAAARAAHIMGEFHPTLEANARERLQAALSEHFVVEFNVTHQCGATFVARRRSR
jgi:FkbM family methyltransferase